MPDYSIIRVIEGKRYNTNTARHITEILYVAGRSDFRWEETDLFLTPKGAWFLAGRGGAMSRWAEREGTGWTDGEGIQPISAATAQRLLEQCNEIDLLEQYFGASLEDA